MKTETRTTEINYEIHIETVDIYFLGIFSCMLLLDIQITVAFIQNLNISVLLLINTKKACCNVYKELITN